MPQFLSATTTSASSVTTKMENAGSRVVVAGSPPTINKTDLNDEDDAKHRSYHSHSRSTSLLQHHVDDESSDGGAHGEYSDEEVVHLRDNGHKNGYHLKISNLETVSRTPKEHFSDQVGPYILSLGSGMLSRVVKVRARAVIPYQLYLNL